MKFKKIYIEITNDCNLNCYFCIHNKREVKYMSMDEFKIVLDKIKGYTKYIYLHVMGEPLMHPFINEFIDYASKDFFVNITTNGYMLEKVVNNKNIMAPVPASIAALLRYAAWINSPLALLSFKRWESPHTARIESSVAKKQNRTNLISHTAEKSESDRSWNSSTGSAILNTNLFILLVNDSSRIPTFRKKSPKIIVRKIGIVAFRLKIRLLIPVFFLPVHFYNLRSSLREASAYSDRRDF